MKPRARFFAQWSIQPVPAGYAAILGLAEDDFYRGGMPVEAIVALVKTKGSLWVESPLGDEWVTAFRLLIQDGQPVIGELRVFPREQDDGERPPGEWSALALGVRARAPRGGLNARLLRRLRFGDASRFVQEFLSEVEKKWPEAFSSGRSLGEMGLEPPREKRRSGEGRGRPGRPDQFYARVARDYVGAIQRGSPRPIIAVAQRRRLRPAHVRDFVRIARKRGLLSEALHQGQKGGVLTAHAKRLLSHGNAPRKPPGVRSSAAGRRGTA